MTAQTLRSLSFLIIILNAQFIFSVSADVKVGTIKQLSIGSGNSVPSGASGSPAIALNGKQMVYNSNAANLVSLDTNNAKDIFVTDLKTGATTRASVNTSGIEGDADSGNPSVSPVAPDGFFITAFESDATNLSGITDTQGNRDIFMRIPSLGITEAVTLVSGSTFANGNSRFPSVTIIPSPNKGLIVFESNATNLVSDDTNSSADIFLATFTVPKTADIPSLLSSIVITRIRTAGQAEPNSDSEHPQISGNGSFIVFSSSATNLIPGTTTSGKQVFLYEIKTGSITLISKDTSGLPGNGDSSGATINYTGRYILYITESSSIASGASASSPAVVIHDTKTGATTRVNSDSTGVAGNGEVINAYLSPNGRFATFADTSSNLITGDTNGITDVFIKDTVSGEIARVSIGETGAEGNAASDLAAFAGNGFTAKTGTFVFRSFATNFTTAGLSSGSDIFANSATLSTQILKRGTTLEVPPDVALRNKKTVLTFENFSSVTRSASIDGFQTRATALTKKFEAEIRKSGSKDIIRQTSKKNQIALNKLKPGNYSARYRAVTVSGSKTVRKTKYSPTQRFTIK